MYKNAFSHIFDIFIIAGALCRRGEILILSTKYFISEIQSQWIVRVKRFSIDVKCNLCKFFAIGSNFMIIDVNLI